MGGNFPTVMAVAGEKGYRRGYLAYGYTLLPNRVCAMHNRGGIGCGTNATHGTRTAHYGTRHLVCPPGPGDRGTRVCVRGHNLPC
jgi:hypothetical protein